MHYVRKFIRDFSIKEHRLWNIRLYSQLKNHIPITNFFLHLIEINWPEAIENVIISVSGKVDRKNKS